jgi:uncharacterized protein YdeI (YjbR/CyaY-like superfamily)
MMLFRDSAQWESWLASHHDVEPCVWMKIAKKGSGRTSVTQPEALDGALCYGWIDSQRRGHDDAYYLQRYSPRRSKGAWSKKNADRAEALIAACRMRPAGLAAVEAARADGRWAAAYEPQATAAVPPDLAAVLGRSTKARASFEALGKTDRYLVILGLIKARTPRTRASRLRDAIAALEAG